MNSSLNEKELILHQEFCLKHEAAKTFFNDKKRFMCFMNYKNKTSIPFRIYAYSEAILKPVSGGKGEFQKHIPCGFCFHTVSEVDEVFPPVLIRDENAAEEFVKKIFSHVRDIHNRHGRKRICWKEGERKLFEEAEVCWFCGGEFKEWYQKVADHGHFTGNFRGAAHERCNSRARKPKFTPVFFHNLANYDTHLFIKILGNKYGKVTCIPSTDEKYISFSLDFVLRRYLDDNGVEKEVRHEIQFVDSYKFMASSLNNLVRNLEKDHLIETQSVFGKEKLDLLSRKGVYPYDFMDSFEKFEEVLPGKDAFFSKLNGEGISEEDYEHTCRVWKEFGMKNRGE